MVASRDDVGRSVLNGINGVEWQIVGVAFEQPFVNNSYTVRVGEGFQRPSIDSGSYKRQK